MTGNVGGIRPGSPTPDDARRVAPVAAPVQPVAPQAPAVDGDRSGLDAQRTGLEAQAGPVGEQAMAAGPADDFDGFAGFGTVPAAPPQANAAQAAVAYVGETLAALQGPKAAEATAALLGNPQAFVEKLRALQELQGKPEFIALRAKVDQIAALATPATLIRTLGNGPFSKDMIINMARLRALPDPALQGALDKAAKSLLPGLKPEAVDEATAVLVGNMQDPAPMAGKVEEWTRQAYEETVGKAHGEQGVKDAMQAFQAKLQDLAQKTGADPRAAAEKVLQEKHGEIEHKAKEGRSLWKKLTGGISGLIEGVTSGLGKALKFATDGIGKVAHFAINVTGKIQTFGLDLGAAALDAVGAKGAAKAVRGASEFVQKTYDAVGNQVQLFAEGAGSAFRDTVTGIGAAVAHPIQTVQGIAHLVAHPSEIPKVAKALWDTATEKGPAYALGYIAGNVLPAILTGGSSTEGTLAARLGAIAGESEVLTSVGRVAGGLGEAAAATRLGGAAIRGYSAVAKVAGRVTEFTSVPFKAAGRVLGESQQVQRAVAFVRRAGTAVGESPVGRAAKRLSQAYEDRVVAINNVVDDTLRGGLKRLDRAGAGLTEAVEGRFPQLAEDAAAKAAKAEQAAKLAELTKVERNLPARELTDADRALLERHGRTIEEVEDLNARGLGKNPGAEHKDKLVAGATPDHDEALLQAGDRQIARNRKLYDDREGALERIGNNQLEDGSILEGARPHGGMPNLRVNFDHARLAEARAAAGAIAKESVSAEEKLQQVLQLVNGAEGRAPLLRAASTNAETNALFEELNAVRQGQKFHLSELDTYLDNGVGDCRHFAATSQSLLQEAVPELNPRIVYTTTFEKAENGTVLAVNHAFNVVTIGGEEIAFDSILPHFTGGKVKDYVNQGLFGREVRFVQDRFQLLEGRWSTGNTRTTPLGAVAAAAGQLGQQMGM